MSLRTQGRREGGTTPVTLKAESFTDPHTNPCPWLNIHTANLPKPSKCNSLCPPEPALSEKTPLMWVCVYIYKNLPLEWQNSGSPWQEAQPDSPPTLPAADSSYANKGQMRNSSYWSAPSAKEMKKIKSPNPQGMEHSHKTWIYPCWSGRGVSLCCLSTETEIIQAERGKGGCLGREGCERIIPPGAWSAPAQSRQRAAQEKSSSNSLYPRGMVCQRRKQLSWFYFLTHVEKY